VQHTEELLQQLVDQERFGFGWFQHTGDFAAD
jgi:hypothetical protein